MKISYSKTNGFIALSAITLSLMACGGGGGDEQVSNPPSSAAAATLNFNAIKNFQFAWTDVSDATFYKVLENADGASGFTQVGNDIAQGTEEFSHSVPLYARMNAQYILQTCNLDGCLDSSPFIINDSLTDAVGYFKSNRAESGRFGGAIALSADGTTLAVGASSDESGDNGINPTSQSNPDKIGSGAVYIFTQQDGAWGLQAYIKPTFIHVQIDSRFGSTLSLSDDGNTLAIGTPFYDLNVVIPKKNVGAVTVYSRSNSTWQQDAFINLTDPNHFFGESLALSGSGSHLAISGSGKDNVHIYAKTGDDWIAQELIDAPYDTADDTRHFGSALAFNFAGNLLAIGAPGDDSDSLGLGGELNNTGASNSGAVFVYTNVVQQIVAPKRALKFSGSNSEYQYIKASLLGDGFGTFLDFNKSGSVLAVASISINVASAVYIFAPEGFGAISLGAKILEQKTIISAENLDEDDSFDSLSLSDDGKTLVVGADLEDSQSTGLGGDQNNDDAINSGAAYVFTNSGSNNWQQTNYIKASNTDAGDQFGHQVAISGDGKTIAIGAQGERSNAIGINGDQDDNSEVSSGAVYLY